MYPITTLALLAASGPAFTVTDTASPTTYGTLSHFDAINDTGQPTNGFEIELEGVAPGDVFDTFGDPANPYIRYGKAAVIERNSTGTIVRYASPYDPVSKMFTQTTPAAPLTYPATLGHQCYALGDPGYPTSGCEHFGVTVNGNPTKTTYRWLVGDATTGTLKVAGSKRSV